MNNNPPSGLPENAPFSHQQKVALQALLPSLNASQASWLSGFFAAISMGTAAGNGVGAAPVAVGHAPTAATIPLTILVGTESGNSEICAAKAKTAAAAAGFAVNVVDMGDYDQDKLAKEENLLVIVSTWGEGEPPQRAQAFYDWIMGDSAPKLEKTRFSVFALGDTSYADFCKCGKDFDQRLADLGATRFADRVDADVDFDPPFEEWWQVVLPRLVELTGAGKVAATAAAGTAAAVTLVPDPQSGFGHDSGIWNKKNPFPAKLKQRILLNGQGSLKETIHVELDLAGSGLYYKPGDALGVVPVNCPQVVDDMLRLAGFRGDEIFEQDGRFDSLQELLTRDYDVTGLSKHLLGKYAPFAKNKQLERLLQDDNAAKLQEYIYGREIRDLFLDFPPADNLSTDQFLGLLRKLPPRLYSIASSLKAHPDEVHLTVGVVRYNAHNKERKGVCSSYLADLVQTGDTVPVYIHENRNFALPADPDTPIIMVGPGTGIAPFRAFIEERVATGAKGKNWLFFGDQRFQYDFLYQLEWQDYLNSGALNRLDVAFSRDTEQKVYVQHRMLEQAKQLYAWLQEGACFYVCGDASRMAKDVHKALIDIYVQEGGMSSEAAEAAVQQLQKDRRYQKDVY